MAKRLSISRGVIAGFVLGFVCLLVYLAHPHGYAQLKKLEADNRLWAIKVEKLQHDIHELEQSLESWQNTPWYEEKVMREQLHLKYPNEEIYKITE